MAVYYSVWVGGAEVNDFPLTFRRATEVAQSYINVGYDDVHIAEVK